MFTPQRKTWGGWSLTPRTYKSGASGSESNLSRGDGTLVKGKDVAFVEPPTPVAGNVVGPSDLAEKIAKLEHELFEYQYNMGLLLIEKKEWASKYDELSQALSEEKDALKREQAAHLIAIDEVEKREENLRKALGVEKQCVLDLEKTLHEMRSENAEIKFTADSKLAEANALITCIEEKSLEVEMKLRSADAKLAEVSRKTSEIERKSQEVESRESVLRREHSFFFSEREANESTLSKQREDLREWERKLQEGEERLAKGQRIVNEREERANENDKVLKQKEKDLEEVQKRIDAANLTLKRKEDDINSRLTNLTLKEKESDAMRKSLEFKSKELVDLEERLTAREKVEIQKLLDEHNAILDAKKHEFELEIEQRRKTLDEELKSRVSELEKKESEVNHMEEKIGKREQALDKRIEKFKEKEKEFELKLRAQKEREKTIKSEEKNLETEKKRMLADKDDLLSLKAEVEKVRAFNEEELVKIHEKEKQLKVSEEERAEYLRLQTELKDEIEKCRAQEELLLKDAEDLKQQKETFEREWEELDEKRTEIQKEMKNVTEQKEEVEKLKFSVEERLKNERQTTQDYIQREMKALEVAKESFEASMEHERSMVAERAEIERSQMLHDFELQKRKLEIDLQNRQEAMEKYLQEKEKSFEDEKERELNNINYLREVAKREMEELKMERHRIEKGRQEIDANKKHLKEDQVDIQKDIDELIVLSRRLKDQREQFIKEKDRFISFVENRKSCKNCGELTSEFLLSDLQSLQEIENIEVLPLPRSAVDFVNEDVFGNLAASEGQNNAPGVGGPGSPLSGGTISWLRKCTSKIFRLSPSKGSESSAVRSLREELPGSGDQVNVEEPSKILNFTENEQDLSYTSTREVEGGQDLSVDDQINVNSKTPEVQEDSQPSHLNRGRKARNRGRARVSRTRSVKAVVQDAKAILGEAFELNETEHPNGNAEDSSRGESGLVDKGKLRNGRKRNRARTSQITVSKQDGEESEGQSDSIMAGQPRKRQQTRYNLRRPKSGVAVVDARASSDLIKENEEEVDGVRGREDGIFHPKGARTSVEAASENGGSTPFVQLQTLADPQDGGANTTNKLVDYISVSVEVNGSPEGTGDYGNGDEYRSKSPGGDADGVGDDSEVEDDEEDEESEHPGEKSIGKKLWNFFTT
ncbi:hypothetical protein CFOL_v3_19115 [Cephalotus follicularis]|uniref:Uncharacterized protein n=1 Tax=Cephalotus follicularis TaxID=3775 RepID=A0A1Q3C5V3_CEPFO|nr:hypothetical protein CFOL_v3_19115 [Cephalotus follicularis]